ALDDQLQVAARCVDVQPTQHFDDFAIARHELQQAGRASKHGTTNLALRVLQGKVAMPAGCARETRNFASHRDRVESGFQSISNSAAQRADLPDSRRQYWVLQLRHQENRALRAQKSPN